MGACKRLVMGRPSSSSARFSVETCGRSSVALAQPVRDGRSSTQSRSWVASSACSIADSGAPSCFPTAWSNSRWLTASGHAEAAASTTAATKGSSMTSSCPPAELKRPLGRRLSGETQNSSRERSGSIELAGRASARATRLRRCRLPERKSTYCSRSSCSWRLSSSAFARPWKRVGLPSRLFDSPT